ncbi:hypothetical protein CP963_13635 [Arcobacter cloacae]|uniref:Uncharacterized protein n=1 Tax=Arcobacter cloacae TaxID=1054034 RepID=A0A6M8NKC8_9BACT|nr:hypothetical protein [Arcobacter cloacae]QKF88787.1 hypothetical protein ACLO_0257 [Arcobacter cloacae]RXI37142.1 hypothetical protein CP963_13635 [Arcobacter cloacae]
MKLNTNKNPSIIIFFILLFFSLHWITNQHIANKFIDEKVSKIEYIHNFSDTNINYLFGQIDSFNDVKININFELQKRKYFDNIIANTNNILLIENTIFKEKIVLYLNFFFNTNLLTYLNSRAPPFNS